MNANDIKNKIKSGALSGFYIMAGEEDYLKRHFARELRSAALTDEVFASFNHTVFDGDELDLSAMREALMSPPMMGEYKVVEWRFADLDRLKESEINALIRFAEEKEDYPYALLIITALQDGFDVGSERKRSRLFTRLAEHFEIAVFDKSTDSQLIAWLKRHFDAEEIGSDPASLGALLMRVGHSMYTLSSEVEKLAAYAKANGLDRITPELVDSITSPNLETDAFALSNAIIEKNAKKAFAALEDMRAQRIEPLAVLAQLSRTYGELLSVSLLNDEGKSSAFIESTMKLHSYRARLYIGAAKKLGTKRISTSLESLIETEAKAKSGGSTGYKAIEIFITKNI